MPIPASYKRGRDFLKFLSIIYKSMLQYGVTGMKGTINMKDIYISDIKTNQEIMAENGMANMEGSSFQTHNSMTYFSV